ncbi:AmmeMemoRadiSam system protein B [Pseudazoarcus pumilus]|uniref:MEMO1 family protein C0099_08060 n=1 Tax=Pseudazoarcus pumilus TaxID=2067960 RepID=A0A2I6S6J7_9RHOO|nr:AmmeMemoRadiSam system protein B [Pseudazoarcus pumilus]AUN94887.1 AmmeMemoRadiSam system protein B [Pseudazoarcus pumilus]
MAIASIRPAAVAGHFYPADPELLRARVSELLTSAMPAEELTAAPKALVVPHAGYLYSGAIAANGYASLLGLRGKIRRVVLLGPPHRLPVTGFALAAAQGFSTPLGVTPVDRALWTLVQDQPDVVVDDRPHALEHCIEVQLPFLQTLLEHFEILPLLVGPVSAQRVADMLDLLWSGPETLILISSDLSHYLSYEDARALDRATARQMLDLRPGLHGEQACGAHALNGLLLACARRGLEPYLLDLRNSGDTAGDRSRVVGYASVAFVEFPTDRPHALRH